MAAGREALLPAIAVGDPEVGAVPVEQVLQDPLAAAGGGPEHRAVAVVQHPRRQKLRPATLSPVSSEASTGLARSRSTSRPAWAAKGAAPARVILTSAPALILTPKTSWYTPRSRSKPMFWLKRRCSASARRFGPNGEPGAMSAGGAALKRRAQCGQVPPISATRVTSGRIGGISMWS